MAGACTAAPAGPQRSGGRGRPGFLVSARNGRSPGEETSGCTVAARGKRRSRPLPTKAIDEAVGERGSGRPRKEIWQGSDGAFNVRQIGRASCRERVCQYV